MAPHSAAKPKDCFGLCWNTRHRTLGAFAVCLRMQLDATNPDFKGLAPERAYADFILAHLALLYTAWNYIG
jgi:hypothetical protein